MIAIGASAGGLEALQAYFRAAPTDSDLAYVVLQHFAPDHRTLMVELLSRQTPLPIQHATPGTTPAPNHVYVLTPGQHLGLDPLGRFTTTPRPDGPVSVIDTFFVAGARTRGPEFVAVILSGTGSDGAAGAEAVRAAGGLVAVQEPTSARFDGMPRAVLAALTPDVVAPPELLPSAIAAQLAAPPPADVAAMEVLLGHLHTVTGVHFDHYKRSTLLRRVQRRMSAVHLTRLEDYVVFARDEPNEIERLGKELLISVTQFFRDPEAFEALRAEVGALIERAEVGATLRVWSVGCATGEEAYSLGMLFHRHPAWRDKRLALRLFATDIDREALEVAGAGCYAAAALRGRDDLDGCFRATAMGFTAERALRQDIVFSYHDIIDDTPLTKIDLLVCRNVLIYFDVPLQRRVLDTFRFSLVDNGILFLGTSEQVPADAGFEVIDAARRLFRRLPGRARPLTVRPLALGVRPSVPSAHEPLLRSAYVDILSRARAAALLVSSTGELLHVLCNPQGLLRIEAGAPTLLAATLLPRPLGALLTLGLPKAVRDEAPVRYSGVAADVGDTVFTLEIRPLAAGRREATAYAVEITAETSPAAPGRPQRLDLETELRDTRESLGVVVEQLGAANEELQATNEELIAANEELQSANEELQSMNEELLTVNNEYQSKISELDALSTDLDQLLGATSIATVFLDADLRIRRFSVGRGFLVRLRATDIGRPLTDFAFASPPIVAAAHAAAGGATPLDATLRDEAGREHLLRARPSVGGPVLTFIDVTELHDAHRRLQDVLDALPSQACVVDGDGVITYVNRSWSTFAEQNGGDDTHTGIGVSYIDAALADAPEIAHQLERLVTGAEAQLSIEYPCDGPDQPRWFRMFAAALPGGGAVISHIDLSEPHAALVHSERLQAMRQELFDALPDAALVIEDGAVTEANAAAHQLLGGSPVGQRLGGLFTEAAEVAERDLIDGAVLHWTRRGPGREPVELRVGRTPTGLVLTLRDDAVLRGRMTAREDALRRDALESLGRLAGGVAHDINNLLAQIVNITELIRANDALPADVRADLQLILAASAQGASTVRSLIAFAHGKPGAPRARVSLRAAVVEVATLVGRTDPRLIVEPGDDPQVEVDRPSISQAVLNLLRNALDPDVHATEVRVSIGQTAEWATVTVSDDGLGMNEDVRRRAMEPFFTTKPTGTGLGLSSAFGTLEDHGGTLTLASRPGEGTTATLRLPRPDRQAPSAPVVLVVDDEPIITRTLQRWLTRPDATPRFEVLTANSPASALEHLDRGVIPQLMVCDIVMPGIPGPVLIHQIERRIGPVPVVFITGFARSEVPAELAARPSTRILEKPFPLERLWAEMLAVLGAASAEPTG